MKRNDTGDTARIGIGYYPDVEPAVEDIIPVAGGENLSVIINPPLPG
jgi:hypothetical protein